MSEEYHSGTENIYPYDHIEGQDSYELLRFKAFADVLIRFVERKRGSKTIEEWCEMIIELVQQLVPDHDDHIEERRLIEHRLTQMKQVSEEVEAVSFGVFQTALLASLFSEGQKRSFVTGGVTFCSMLPMRSVPFKITAVLGMNRGLSLIHI